MTAPFPDGEPALSGEVQFWRMDPETWGAALRSVRGLGIRTIATYLSWRRHEPTEGAVDLRGGHGSELDVHRFLSLCREMGLRVILKPGPWICAEEKNGGFPDWVVGDASLLARDHRGEVVRGYNPPFVHPMPSYASTRFRRLVRRWITRVWSELAEFTGPDGPVVATQYDNEPSLGFRDTMFGFDWHPDALASWRDYAGADVAPPRPRTGAPERLTDVESMWARWQRDYIADYLSWLASVHAEAGVSHLVGTVNLNTHPVRGWPQDGSVVVRALPGTVVGEDHYFVPPLDADDLTGLALAAAQGRASGTPLVWAPEMQAGIWRSPGEVVEYPDPTVDEMIGWWGAALAFGYQGFNLYMLVDRENWEAAPLGPSGELTELGRALRAFIDIWRSVPDLADFRPVADVEIAWSDDLRSSAYRVRGTQAEPLTDWDDPAARAAYDRAVQLATDATVDGRQFDLVEHPKRPGDPAAVGAPAGYLARVHEHSDGRRVLVLVRWSRDAARGSVRVSLPPDSRMVALQAPGGGVLRPDGEGVVTIGDLEHGLAIFAVLAR